MLPTSSTESENLENLNVSSCDDPVIVMLDSVSTSLLQFWKTRASLKRSPALNPSGCNMDGAQPVKLKYYN
nr:hypothetical protein [Candidatus Freyarchaeota archaeon]